MLRLGVLVLGAFLAACKVVIVSGPTVVVVGDTVTYVLEVSTDLVDIDPFFTLVAGVPAGWELLSSTYVATSGGAPVSGNAVVAATYECGSSIGPVRPGYQTLHIQNETTFAVDASDTGQVTLDFRVDDQPAGEFEIFFAFGSTDCSLPTVLTINRQGPKFLTLVRSLFDDTEGLDGLAGPGRILPSADGRHLYVAAGVDQSVAALARDPGSGAVSLVEVEAEGVAGVTGLGLPCDLALSPDGDFLYAASLANFATADQGGVAVFSRDPANGEITFVERLFEAVGHLAVSPDGKHLYAADSAVIVYSRNEVSGGLTYVESGLPGGQLTISPDGKHLYALSPTQLHVYGRDESSGELTSLAVSGSGITVALSPDGRFLYILRSSGLLNTISILERDAVTGLLSLLETVPDVSGDSIGLSLESMVISPDGRHLVAGGRVGIVVFQRNRFTGGLTHVETLYEGHLSVDDLEGLKALAFAPGGRHLFATSLSDDALLVLETSILFSDGFESGSTSAWSAIGP